MKRILFIFTIVIGFCVVGYAQNSVYNGSALRNTYALPGATVRVCTMSAVGTPCSPLAITSTDATGATACANTGSSSMSGAGCTNPGQADANGNFTLYAAPGWYQVQISATNFQTLTYPIFVAPDPVTPPAWGTGTPNAGFFTNLTATGTLALPSQINIKNLNGAIRFADQYPGGSIDAQVNACISDLMTNNGGGICDARALKDGQILNQIDVGSNATPNNGIVLLLPKKALWSVNMIAPTACGMMIHDKSAVLGMNGQGNGNLMNFASGSATTNVLALVCTDPAPGGGGAYIRAEGFGVNNGSFGVGITGTMQSAAFVANHLFDNSVFRDIVVSNPNGVGMLVDNACCGTAFYNVLADGAWGTGALPIQVGTAGGAGVNTVGFFGVSATHSGAGQPDIFLAGNINDEQINFYDTYMEGNPVGTDLTTAFFQIGGGTHNVYVNGLTVTNVPAGSTAYLIDVASGTGNGNDTFVNIKSQTKNLVNDHIRNFTYATTDQFGAAPFYSNGNVIHAQMQLLSTSQPTCNAQNQFMFQAVAGATNVKDSVQVCAKDASNVFAWRTIY